MKASIKFLAILVFTTVFVMAIVSCGSDKKSSSQEETVMEPEETVQTPTDAKFHLSIVEKSNKKAFLTNPDPAANPVQGIYFSGFNSVAYNYRPGEKVQTTAMDKKPSADWSSIKILSTQTDGFVLKTGEALELKKYASKTIITEDYATEVGTFRIDFITFDIYCTAVFTSDALYQFAEDEGYKAMTGLPALRTASYKFPLRDDAHIDSGSVHLVLARDDWFSESLFVSVDITGEITANKTLTADQHDKLISLMQAHYRNSTGNYFFYVIPYGSAQEVSAVTCAEYDKCDAKSIDDLTFMLQFDLSDPVEEYEDLTGTSNAYNWRVHLKGDENGVPFGLKANVQ